MFILTPDAEIMVQQAGDPRAPAVLFVHGTGSWSEAWRPSMAVAAGLGYHAVAIDLPPFGYSSPPQTGDFSKAAQAKRILAVLDALAIDKAVFVGHSFGAGPLMEAAFAAPERVSAVILVDAALGLQGPPDATPSRLQSLLRVRWLSEALSAAFLTNPWFTKPLLQAFMSEKERATDEWVNLYRRPLVLDGAYEGVAAWLPELFAPRGTALSDDPARYAALRSPVTLIWGETDAITPIGQATHLQQLVPGSRLIRLPRAGHIPQIEEPAAFSAALKDALNALQ